MEWDGGSSIRRPMKARCLQIADALIGNEKQAAWLNWERPGQIRSIAMNGHTAVRNASHVSSVPANLS
jgi:hypothetical protein